MPADAHPGGPPSLPPGLLPLRIETDRLTLRPWETRDAVLLHEALVESTAALRRWIPWATPEPPTAEEAGARLQTWIEEFAAQVTYVYGAFDRSGVPVGGIGLYPRIGPGGLEIGYWIRQSRDGQGFATEGARALTHVAFTVPDVDRTEIHCASANAPSRRVAEKLGYPLLEIRREDAADGGQVRETAVYRLTREQYDQGRLQLR